MLHQVETAIAVAAIALLLIAARAVFVHCRPYRECRWCRKGGLIAGSVPGRTIGLEPLPPRRRRRCWRCKGSKLTRRLGARHTHKLKLALRQAWDERGQRADPNGGAP